MLVEIGSTVAIADSSAPELVSALKAEWQDCTPADSEDAEDIPFAHEAAVDVRLAMLAHDRDVAWTGAGWPQSHRFWASSMDSERLAGLSFLYTSY